MEWHSPKTGLAKFDSFTADFRSGELWKRDHRIRLPELPFRLLTILIENAGEMVAREELRQRLWPEDLFIDFDNNLNTAIAKIRRALNDSAGSPRYVETLGRRGYRFIAPVEIMPETKAGPTRIEARAMDPHQVSGTTWWAGQLPVGVIRLDPSGRVRYTNRKWTEIVGYSPRQMDGEKWWRVVYADDLKRVLPDWEAARCLGHSFVVEFRVLRPDGEITWVSMQVQPETEVNGGVSGYFAVLADVNERHLATAALNESEQRFKALAEHLPGVVYICKNDACFTKVYVGGPTEALTGYSNAEIMSGMNTFPALYTQEDADRIRREVQAAVQARRPYHLTYQFRHRSGEWKWAEEFGAGIFDRDGNLLHIECFVTDITERKTLEERVRQSQKMEAIGTLAGGVAHEFNNVLTVIKGYSQLLLSHSEDSRSRREIAEITKATARAESMVRRLLAFSRPQAAQPSIINPNVILRELYEMLGPVLGEDIRMVLRLDPQVPSFRFDPTQVQQVLLNLVINARDAMPAGGTLTLEASRLPLGETEGPHDSVLSKGEYIRIRVSDTGCGMPPEVKQRIFEPFFTTKPTGAGTGLGLSTVFGMVKQNGGHITVESEPGEGTTFDLWFPAELAEPEPPLSAPAVSFSGTGTVLVVEDDAAVRDYAVDVLREFGFATKVAGSFEEALTIASADPSLDILMTDIRLPGGDGWTLAKHIVALRPTVRIVYASGYFEELAAGEAATPDCEFLRKPFSPKDLADCLAKLATTKVQLAFPSGD